MAIIKLLNYYAKEGLMLPRARNAIYENLRDYILAVENNRLLGCGALHFVCNIHLHDTLHHTFAFINIHLDIHRIIIIITYKLASASKEEASEKREKEAILCFTVYTKKGRCFSPMAQKY